jgi:hypothetical protein
MFMFGAAEKQQFSLFSGDIWLLQVPVGKRQDDCGILPASQLCQKVSSSEERSTFW